ncbi:hypothetical protein Purlil1_14141 [Purpureocillium lilacinum]|uniref:Uncharacterized protein n=1 Tax=Purpureocillium lilacinum TaxID=33203 RepID=A0ABR0BC48_PURLI|nr:hypothetical protein Purlil1_14141 [Purpureocillium lilacinum]
MEEAFSHGGTTATSVKITAAVPFSPFWPAVNRSGVHEVVYGRRRRVGDATAYRRGTDRANGKPRWRNPAREYCWLPYSDMFAPSTPVSLDSSVQTRQQVGATGPDHPCATYQRFGVPKPQAPPLGAGQTHEMEARDRPQPPPTPGSRIDDGSGRRPTGTAIYPPPETPIVPEPCNDTIRNPSEEESQSDDTLKPIAGDRKAHVRLRMSDFALGVECRGVVALYVLPSWNLLNARYRWRSGLMGNAIAEPTGIDPDPDRRGTRKNTSATLVPGLTARVRVE